MRLTKRKKKIAEIIEEREVKTLEEAIDILQKCPKIKFDESIDLSIKLGVDPKKADQQVRGTVSLPNGTGKKVVIAVFAKGDKVKEAEDAGADYVGHEELVNKVKGGWTDFNAIIATPDMMREVGKLGKILGPRGLMPSPKAGTVTNDVAKAINDVRAGKVEFKVDKSALINNAVGKKSFSKEKLVENINVLLQAIMKIKPASAKGIYMKSVAISSTMGPGMFIDLQALALS